MVANIFLRDILNFLAIFIMDILIKCILITKKACMRKETGNKVGRSSVIIILLRPQLIKRLITK